MSQERLIKKYANRRLYDASQSRHITLDDIRALIVKGEKIRVVEDKTGHDITRHILLQVIAEQEQFGRPILSTPVLEAIIRFYGNCDAGLPRRASSRRASRRSCTIRRTCRTQISKMVADTPLATVADLTRQNLESAGEGAGMRCWRAHAEAREASRRRREASLTDRASSHASIARLRSTPQR